MKKKHAIFLTAMAMIFGLSACGNVKNSNTEIGNSKQNTDEEQSLTDSEESRMLGGGKRQSLMVPMLRIGVSAGQTLHGIMATISFSYVVLAICQAVLGPKTMARILFR